MYFGIPYNLLYLDLLHKNMKTAIVSNVYFIVRQQWIVPLILMQIYTCRSRNVILS